jgi:nuclease S1
MPRVIKAMPSPWRAALTMLVWALAGSALAWGSQGHQIVATVAQAQLTAKARSEIDRLLLLEPGATLVSISTWADERSDPATAAWHYVNFPPGSCSYDARRDCPDGNCVIDAINRQLQILTSAAPGEDRLTALKYLVHFVADVHQPLHGGRADDRGGNRYQLQEFMQASNLHALWDFGMIRSLGQETATLASRLLALSLPLPATDPDITQAAEESCRIVATPGFYPGRKVDAAYIERFTPVMERRLATAGARLAGLLNRALR